MKKTFVQVVVEKFKFLVRDYGFEIQSSTESPRNYLWEGWVEYCNQSTYIEIECTRGENPTLSLGRKKDVINKDTKRPYLLSIDLIYEYVTLTQPEKDIVTSLLERSEAGEILYKSQLFFQLPDAEKQIITSLTQQEQAGNIIYQEKYIGHEVPSVDNLEKQRELELETYARLMRKYAEPFLLGDFSHWSEIWEYLTQKSIAGWIQPERSEFPRFAASDKTGRQKIYGKQQYEENPRDYIEQLKKNVYGDNLDYIKQLKAEMKQIN
jgi:hypothetical protein